MVEGLPVNFLGVVRQAIFHWLRQFGYRALRHDTLLIVDLPNVSHLEAEYRFRRPRLVFRTKAGMKMLAIYSGLRDSFHQEMSDCPVRKVLAPRF